MENNPSIPTIKKIYDHTKYYMDVNCYDLIYEDIYNGLSEAVIESIMIKFRNVYSKDGDVCCDCQNVILEGWVDNNTV